MAFDAPAVRSLLAAVESIALRTGQFRSVNTHEPKSAPGSGLRCAIWAQQIAPLARVSGLSATAAYVVLNARVYGNMLAKPEDQIDPRLMTAATVLIAAFSADFTLGGTVMEVDLLGSYGSKLSGQAGYVTIGGEMYRIFTITVPVVLDAAWTQESTS